MAPSPRYTVLQCPIVICRNNLNKLGIEREQVGT